MCERRKWQQRQQLVVGTHGVETRQYAMMSTDAGDLWVLISTRPALEISFRKSVCQQADVGK